MAQRSPLSPEVPHIQPVAELRWWTDRIRDYSGLDADVKVFGRRGHILTARGWGHWDADGREWTPAPPGTGATHTSRAMYR